MANSQRSIREISISNLGVIASTTLELDDGFNVLTGETGAGKTMILTALGLLAGEKADADLIRVGAEKLSVSTILQSEDKPSGTLSELLIEQDPEMEQGLLVLARSVSKDGKNRAQAGSSVTTVGAVAKFASEFYTIHGQGSNQRLRSSEHQRRLIDTSESTLLEKVVLLRNGVLEMRRLIAARDDFRKSLKNRDEIKRRLESFRADFTKVLPRSGELESIDSRIRLLDSAERSQGSLNEALGAIDDEESGAIHAVAQALRALAALKESGEMIASLSQRLAISKNELSDIRNELANILSQLDLEPGEVNRLRERRAALVSFLRKHSDDIDGNLTQEEQLETLISHADSITRQLAELEGGDEHLVELEENLERSFKAMFSLAQEVSSLRKRVASQVVEKVLAELSFLGLEGSVFTVEFADLPVTGPEDFPVDGLDVISFKFASHTSITPHPLTRGISGGELSRLMLAIELALLSENSPSTIIFDEVDSGIGGETANIVGERLSRLAKLHQIIVVTHLPQVAVWADHHFVISKSADDEYVQSSVQKVNGEPRVQEIARMLSGEVEREAALSHARSLLKHASIK